MNGIDRRDHGLIKHGTILLVATVITGLSNTAFNFIMARLLGREDYGDLIGLMALHMILVLPLSAVQMVTARYVSALEGQRRLGQAAALLRRSVIKLSLLSVGLVLLFLALGPMLAVYLNVDSLAAVYVVGVATALALLVPVFWGALQGFQYFYHYAFNQIISTFVKLGGGILLVWLGFGVAGAVGSLLMFYLFAAGLALAALYVVLFKLAGGDEEVDSRPHYRFFWSVFISLLAFAVFTQVDALAVKHFFERHSAGEYGFARVVGQAFLFIPIAISTALFPKVTRSEQAGGGSSLGLLNLSLLFCLLLCGVGLVACALLAGLVRELLFPEGTETTVRLIRIIGLGVTPVALLNILINYFLARGRSSFLYLLVPLALAYAGALQLWHGALEQVVWLMGGFGLAAFALLYLTALAGERSRAARPAAAGRRQS